MTDRFFRDHWLRRLRGLSVVVPLVGAVCAAGLTGMFARHDSAAASTTKRSSPDASSTRPTPSATPTRTPSATKTHEHRQVRRHTRHARPPRPAPLTSAPTSAPVTHSGGS